MQVEGEAALAICSTLCYYINGYVEGRPAAMGLGGGFIGRPPLSSTTPSRCPSKTLEPPLPGSLNRLCKAFLKHLGVGSLNGKVIHMQKGHQFQQTLQRIPVNIGSAGPGLIELIQTPDGPLLVIIDILPGPGGPVIALLVE